MIERAYQLGIRHYDTAPLYGYGLAELRLGRALTNKPRTGLVIATKVGRLLRADAPPEPGMLYKGRSMYQGTPPLNPIFDFSYDGVMRSLDESLERLGLERVDILHIHDSDAHFSAAVAGAYRALDNLRKQGVIGAVGVGQNQSEMLARYAREGDFDCFLLAGRYTLLDQTALDELLPLCVEKRIAVIAGGVYNSGILARPGSGARFNYVPAGSEWLEKAELIRAVCERHNVPLRAAALQFPLAHPAVACVVIGARSVQQLEDSVAMFGLEIPHALWDELRKNSLIPEAAPVPN